MSLESRKHMLETPRSPAAKAAVTTVAEVSSTNGVFAHKSPRRFSSLGRSRAALLPLNCPPLRRVAAPARTLPVRHLLYKVPWRLPAPSIPMDPASTAAVRVGPGNTLTQRRNNDDSHQ